MLAAKPYENKVIPRKVIEFLVNKELEKKKVFCTGNIDRQSHKVVFKPLIEKRNKCYLINIPLFNILNATAPIVQKRVN